MSNARIDLEGLFDSKVLSTMLPPSDLVGSDTCFFPVIANAIITVVLVMQQHLKHTDLGGRGVFKDQKMASKTGVVK